MGYRVIRKSLRGASEFLKQIEKSGEGSKYGMSMTVLYLNKI